jgi:tripartite-type tricarboxylate transporter receptor subunit TctC
MRTSRRSFLSLCAAVLAAAAGPVAAQDYPSKPIRLVVPFAPGGGTDILARTVVGPLGERLGQPVVIDNRPGAGSQIGMDIAAKAAPDGYTLVMTDTSVSVNPSLYAKLPYDTEADFAPISLLASGPVILLVHPSVPAESLKEFLALAKAKPGQLNYASGGNGASTHLGGELLKMVAGIDLVHVPYKGTAPGLTDLLGGQVQMMIGGISSARPYVDGGKLRGLAVTGEKRNPALPDVPTFAEAGLPGVDAGTYWSLWAPAKTPDAVIQRVYRETASVLQRQDIRDRLSELGYETIAGPPEALSANLKSEIAKWRAVVAKANIKID